ncbi:8366_t:CDS:1 [Scutellospora calospora]|uniref:8366_t:CDS:1 n=1 Tax=Scutellospora calospora TaxID=85575 RepID=A0ACA9JYV9_9GLOM|nr:8366_t:CDS:1 [Scutellospora calospora]
MNEAYMIYGDSLYIKGNDMELFHFLTGGPQNIIFAPVTIHKNIEKIKKLILEYKFAPFPLRNRNSTREEDETYPSYDGFENNKQLNVIARSILLNLTFVKYWKEIGYYNVCDHLNSLVLQGAFLILFPPNSASFINSKESLVKRLKELIEVGFIFNDKVIFDIFLLEVNHIDVIGDVIFSSFVEILKSDNFKIVLYDKFMTEANDDLRIKLINFISKYH